PLRRADRPARHPRRRSRAAGRRLGPGAGLGPAGRARGRHRPERAAAAASHHGRAGQDVRPLAGGRRSRRGEHRAAVAPPAGRGVPAAPHALMATATRSRLDRLSVTACRVPTDAPEQDGTFSWQATTIVLVEAEAGGETGLGYTYADASAAALI